MKKTFLIQKGRNQNRGNGHNKSRSKNDRSKSRNPKNSQTNKKYIECWNCEKKMDTIRMSTPKKDNDDDNKTNSNIMYEELDDSLICSLESKTESWVLDPWAFSMLPQVDSYFIIMSQVI